MQSPLPEGTTTRNITGRETTGREFTGRHMLAICVLAFGTIIAVNLFLAFSAVQSFPGVNVKNSYVASQEFDDRRAAQEGLGWDVRARIEGAVLVLSLRDQGGQPVEPAEMSAILGRATHVKEDRVPAFRFDGQDYRADVAGLGVGKWALRLEARDAAGTLFAQRIVLVQRG